MKDYHSMMTDIAVQLVQKWERLNPNEEVDISEDMTTHIRYNWLMWVQLSLQ